MFVLMISIIIALIIVVFAVQNALTVQVQFLVWSADLPLVLVIFCSVFAGALLMFCLALWRDLKNQMKKNPKKEAKGKMFQRPKKAGTADPASVDKNKSTESKPESKTDQATAGGKPSADQQPVAQESTEKENRE